MLSTRWLQGTEATSPSLERRLVRPRELIGQSAASALIRGLGMLLSLLLSVVMARTLSPSGYGTYAFVLSTVVLLSIPAKFGLPIHVTRGTAQAMASGDTATVWALWGWGHRLILLCGGLVILALAGWLAIIVREDHGTWLLWLWGGLLVPIISLAHLRAAAIRGLGHPLLSQFPEMILRPALILGLALAGSVALGDAFSATQAVMFNVLGSGVVFALGVGLMLRLAPVRPPRETWPNDPALRRTWLISTLTLGLTVGAQTLGANMDVIMLGMMRNEVEVGIYKVALNSGGVLGFGLQAINMVLFSRIAQLYHRGEIEEIRNLVRVAARIALLATVPILALLLIYGQWLITIVFGSEYETAYVTVIIIGTGQFVSVMFGSVLLVVNMTGNEKFALRGTIGFALLNIVLNAVLIPIAGRDGAAIATAVSLAALNFYLWFIAWRRAGINTLAFGPVEPKGRKDIL